MQPSSATLESCLAQLGRLAVLALVAAAAAFPARAAAATQLSGAGSTLAAPLVAEWAQTFLAFDGIGVSYTEVGSAAGIGDVSSGAVDFAASDAPLTSTQTSTCPTCFQIPWGVSAIGIGYNVPHIGVRLLLTGRVIAEIYLHEITRWNDSRIRALNPRLPLPSLRITPIYEDGSGNTYVFTDYLSRIDATWRSRVGRGVTVSFPTGVPESSTATGITQLESITGAIAYVGAPYLIAHRLPAAAIRNSAGNYEYPNLDNIESAARTTTTVPANGALELVNPPRGGRAAYPISTYTYVIVRTNAPQKATLKQWILYALGEGQQFGASLDFAPLPSVVRKAGRAAANSL